jgi:hypothetical protein
VSVPIFQFNWNILLARCCISNQLYISLFQLYVGRAIQSFVSTFFYSQKWWKSPEKTWLTKDFLQKKFHKKKKRKLAMTKSLMWAHMPWLSISNSWLLHTVYLKVGCLFVCFVCLSHWDLANHVPLATLLVLLESPWWVTGALSWFHNVSTLSAKVIEYWTTFSLKFQLNQN